MALFATRRPPPVDRVWPTFGSKFANSSPENPSTDLGVPGSWLFDALGGGATAAGPHVNETTAMRSSAVFRCVALKAGVIASLPLKVYRHTTEGREEAPDHRLSPLLGGEPNDLMSAFIWKEFIVANLMLKGNHYSVIERDGAARITGLLPFLGPARVERIKGRNRYTFTLVDGQEVLDQDEVVHVPGLGFDGVTGISPIQWAGRQAVGIALALEEFTGSIHQNGARPSGVLAVGKEMKSDGVKRLRAEIEQLYSGSRNAGRILLADNGSDWHPMTLSLEDAQTLESRRFQVADIARLFGVPPHLLGQTGEVSNFGTGIEQQTTGFKIYNLEPELSRIEGELNRKLLKFPYYAEFNREAIVAMDAETQAKVLASQIQNGQLTPDEARKLKNRPPKGGLANELFIQSATVPISMAGQKPPPTTPTPPQP